MKLCTIGLGYIGLPSSAMFADHGTEVVGVDIDPQIVNLLNTGTIHIEEPGLEDVIKRVVANGKFRATLTPERADVFLIAVPTPNLNDTYKSCDLKYVISAVNNMLPFLEKGNVVIVESTIAPRTMDLRLVRTFMSSIAQSVCCQDKFYMNLSIITESSVD